MRSIFTPRRVVAAASVAVFLITWQLGSASGWLDPRFYSSPSLILRAGVEVVGSHDLARHAKTTATELGLGWVLGSSAAILVGVLLGLNSTLRKIFDPLLMALYVMPRLAIYPVLVIWLGIGMGSKVAMVVLGSFFLAVINIIAGVRAIPPILHDVGASFGLSTKKQFWSVTLPAAAPSIFTGLRQGLSQGVIAVITAEMFLSLEGIGYLVMRYGQSIMTDHLLFLVLITAVTSYVLITLLGTGERRIRGQGSTG